MKTLKQFSLAPPEKRPGRNPYYQHLYKIGMDGKGFALLTPENANHDVSVSPDGKYFIDNISAPDQPTRTVLRETATGKIIKELAKADIDGFACNGYQFPETFTATARDGITTIYGAMWKPTNFDPQKKYPVIDQSYTVRIHICFHELLLRRSTGVINHLLSLGLLLLRSMAWVQPTVQKHFIMYLTKTWEKSR